MESWNDVFGGQFRKENWEKEPWEFSIERMERKLNNIEEELKKITAILIEIYGKKDD